MAALYEPWRLPVDEPDEAFGASPRSWNDVRNARRKDLGGGFDAPGELGCYDSSCAEVRAAQGVMARRYGVDALFCSLDWPDQSDGRRPLIETVLESGLPDVSAAAWWVVGPFRHSQDRLGVYDGDAHASWLMNLFGHPRYLRHNGRAVVVVERPELIPAPRDVFARWRELARSRDVGELLIIVGNVGHPGGIGQLGADAAIPSAQLTSDAEALAASHPRAGIVGVGTRVRRRHGREGQPGKEGAPLESPAAYRRELAREAARVGRDGLLVVDSWNSWLDDARLEPGLDFGLDWLDAHAAGVFSSVDPIGEAAREVLLLNRFVMRSFEREAATSLASGRLDDALSVARAAADWSCHQTTLWMSPELEAVVSTAGRQLLEEADAWRPTHGTRRRVAHVLTEARSIGGHTRLAWRWMTSDAESEHSVVLTGQGELAIPDELRAATEGRVVSLTSASPIEKVRELAGIFGAFDLVVLHVHPYDVVAVAACADASRRPPTLLLNHADHLFWIGVTEMDAVANIRPSARALCTTRRGVDAGRLLTLPLPLGPPEVRQERGRAREAIGLPASAVVMLTMAAPYKYTPAVGPSLQDLVARVLDDVADAHIVAVGPDASSPGWSGLLERFPERVWLLGTVADTLTVRSAADVYLDSYPFASIT
ncbi:MAG: glycosyl transferase family 1, partial [Acidimicrobiaceae bacterium]|nr:glycosyl transferase family 1 [Acidimicrobiaceae bacterium]